MTSPIPESIVTYLADRERQRTDEMVATLQAMTPREVRLVREAAVMGYVRGALCGRTGGEIPNDSAVVAEVLNACLSMPDLYPVMDSLTKVARS
jgi:hypothetical protein